MRRADSLLGVPPREARPAVPAEARGRVLVVEADYFVLTAKVDPNVLFWRPGDVCPGSKIPKGISHLWVSRYTADGIRLSLLSQAEKRGITVWHCVLGELRRRLMPFWAMPYNRSLNSPALPDKQAADEDERPGLILSEPELPREDTAEQEFEHLRKNGFTARQLPDPAEEPVVRDEEDIPPRRNGRVSGKRKNFLEKRLVLLKAAAERAKRRAEGAPGGEAIDTHSSLVLAKLGALPTLDRKVFLLYCGNGTPPKSVPELAREFGLPAQSVQKIIERVRMAVRV